MSVLPLVLLVFACSRSKRDHDTDRTSDTDTGLRLRAPILKSEHDASGPVEASPILLEDPPENPPLLLVSTTSSVALALDLSTGSENWEHALAQPSYGVNALDGGVFV